MVHARGMAPLPTPVRATIGLVAVAVEQARTLPDRVVELPVLAVSTALQFSLRAQQHYAELAMRGDEVLGRLHEPPEEPPSWATFDDEPPETEAPTDTAPPEPYASAAPPEPSANATPEPPIDSALREPPTDATPSGSSATPSDIAATQPPRRRTKAAEPPTSGEPSALDPTE